MRPQKLMLKNFMPFRATEGQGQIVDFANLDLFAITGPMASGKSSLIDAIVWCLYGRTARYGADSKGVISTGESTCEVAFDFTIGARQFRAVRRTGKTTDSGLSEHQGGEWTQDESGSERLTKRVEELLGLDFDSFTKTVILPQGRYAEFLSSEPSKRRDLLEKILELGVYKRVVDRAKELETRSKGRADTIRETLQRPHYVGVTRTLVEQRREELERIAGEITQTSAREEELRTLAVQLEKMLTFAARLIDLQKEERHLSEEHDRAQQRLKTAEAHLHARTQLLAEVEREREAVGYDARRHETVQRAEGYLREHLAACQEGEDKAESLKQVQQELDTLTSQVTAQTETVEQARRSHEELTVTLRTHISTNGDTVALTNKVNAARRWKELHREHEQLTKQRQLHADELAGIQQTIASLIAQEKTKEVELQTLQQQHDQARAEEQEKRQQEEEAGRLAKELQDAVKEEKQSAQKTEQSRAALHLAEEELQRRQQVVADAERQEQITVHAVEENRKNNEIAHLRTTLHPGEPCPVCLTAVREIPSVSPAVHGDQLALQQRLEQAKTSLTHARHALQHAEKTVAAAQIRKETSEQEFTGCEQKRQEAQARFLARFPGFSSLKDALTALQERRQEITMLLTDVKKRTQTAEQERKRLVQQREQQQRREATLEETLRGIDASLEKDARLLADLDTLLTPYCAQGQDPETVLLAQRQMLLHAEQAVKSADQTLRQEKESLDEFNTKKIYTEGTQRQLQYEQHAARDRAERAAKAGRENLALPEGSPLPALAVITSELETLTQKQEQDIAYGQRLEALRKEKEEAERNLTAAQADLQARVGFFQDARRKVGDTTQELTHARQTLQRAIRESESHDLQPGGEDVKERLTIVQGQSRALHERRSRLEAEKHELEQRCMEKEQAEQKLQEAEIENRLSADLRKLLGAEFTDYLSEGAVKALMQDASVHLQRLTHGRYSFTIEYKRRTIELLIVDHEDQQRARPTHSLSGGETFLASLAIALALSQSFREIATGRAAKTSTECLILDEGFGTLDREGVQLVTETLQELRGEEGRVVGIITHVEEVAAAMPMRIEVRKGSRSSTITVSG